MSTIFCDTAIIGGGIVGLSCAFEEIKQGKSVCIIDKNNIGKDNTSWASAGTLITKDPRKFFSELREFCVRSIDIFPTWLQEIQEISGIEIPFVKNSGCYYLFDTNSENGEKEHKIFWSQVNREQAKKFEILSSPPNFLQKYLTSDYKTVYFPEESYVDNRALLEALVKACTNLGTILVCEAIQNMEKKDNIIRIELSKNIVKAKHCLIAAGAWSSEILRFFNIDMNIIPVKGQMVVMPKFYNEDAMVYFQRDIYLVPRENSVLVGATQEKYVWDKNFDKIGETYIKKYLKKYLPSLTWQVEDKWAGIRSLLKDRYPMMGFVDDSESISICCGHYKVGVAMAPLTAQYMSGLINKKNTGISIDLHHFRPWRPNGLTMEGK